MPTCSSCLDVCPSLYFSLSFSSLFHAHSTTDTIMMGSMSNRSALFPWALLVVVLSLLLFSTPSLSQGSPGAGGTCSDAIPCKSGCCSSSNQCGFTPDHCGTGCKHNCNATAECGQYAKEGDEDCPINVCCSKWGFCGVTEDFCGDGCQNNSDGAGCGFPDKPDCGETEDALSMERRIGYYELFNVEKSCNRFGPNDITVAGLTHLNLAFVNFGSNFKLQSGDGYNIYRAALHKLDNPHLKVCISIGGWTFSDPPDASRWSDMANDYTNRQTFISSVVDFLKEYGLDGVDLDWEYPSADDRGGRPSDADAFVLLVADLREAFDAENPGWTVSVTLPTSYWYLRGFNLENMSKYVSWWNLMSYDLHGTWDHDNDWTGPYVRGHTDITEIDLGLDLLWRNGIKPADVVFGMGFYGRSFTLSSPNCYQPNGVCTFETGGRPGTCSDQSGILTYQEIQARNSTLDVHTFYNSTSTVKFNVFDGDQWVSYDDAQSWADKKRFLSKRCLSGLMIWALDQDDEGLDAYAGVMGDTSLLELEGGGLGPDAQANLADQLAAYTGQHCFVTPRCTDGTDKQKGDQQVCPSGFQSVSSAHTPKQAPGHDYFGECAEGWWREICCPKDAMPQNCKWDGAPVRSEFGCSGHCGSTQFTLNTDNYLDAKGEGNCFSGTRSLCCDSTELISDCYWSPCQGPILSDPECDSGYTFEGYRFDKPDGSPWCSDEYVSPLDGAKGSPVHGSFRSALCCPTKSAWKNCQWSNADNPSPPDGCRPQSCDKGRVQIGTALDPAYPLKVGTSTLPCEGFADAPGSTGEFPLCCDMQGKYSNKWPIDPEKVFKTYYNDADDDVLWQYSDDFDSNDKDDTPDDAEDGGDAYGFLMLDGPEGSVDTSFSKTNTIVRTQAQVPSIKRSLVTHNKTVLDSVFDHAEETFRIYCNFPAASDECARLWVDGAEDTIIGLPDHVGEGPFARIVSIHEVVTDDADFGLPSHHVQHRSEQGIHQTNPVYEVKIDYNFMAITPKRAEEPVYLRVDYTNLLGYWDEVEAAEPDTPGTSGDKRKRTDRLKQRETPDWHSRVQRAIKKDGETRKQRASAPVKVSSDMGSAFSPTDLQARDRDTTSMEETRLDKRWWGVLKAWIKKVTTVEKQESGVIPLGWADSINLFNAQWGCPGQTFSANLKMDLEADFNMDATYAYYFQAAFIPPATPEVYAYLGMEPSAYLGLRLEGNAVLQYSTNDGSGRKKIIDTLAYPGLAVKGIAAVGPTLDVYGEIRGKITIHGEASAGARLHFGKAETYWPADAQESKDAQRLLGLEDKSEKPDPKTVEPTFEAGVEVDAALDIIVQPEANIGVKIGGGSLVSATVVNAQLTGFVTGDLNFQARGTYDTNSGSFKYSYGVYVFYNIGYKATATILNVINWATGEQKAYNPDKRIDVYGPVTGEIPIHAGLGSRDLDDYDDGTSVLYPNSSSSSLVSQFLTIRADVDGDGDVLMPDFTANLKCPPGSTGDVRLPELRFNCDLYGPVQVDPLDPNNPATGVYLTKGMCDGWRGMTARPSTLTYGPVDKNDRRSDQCPTGFCATVQASVIARTGRGLPRPDIDCDEFPPASAEEGGDFYGAASRSQTCVPAFQNQNWGGSSCQILVRGLSTNWGRLDPTVAEDEKLDNWVQWDNGIVGDTWTTDGSLGANPPADSKTHQRMVEYPDEQPPPDATADRASNRHSWLFRRNYTVSIQDNSAAASSWWDASGRSFANARYTVS